MEFAPDESPRAVLAGELSGDFVRAVVVGEARRHVVRLADVELPNGILQNVDPKHVGKVAPEVGFEPTTNRLTADRSTTELLRTLHRNEAKKQARAMLSRFRRPRLHHRCKQHSVLT